MISPERAREIRQVFQRQFKGDSRDAVKEFSRKELLDTLAILSDHDMGAPYTVLISQRIQEIATDEDRRRERRIRLWGMFWGAVIGIAVSVIGRLMYLAIISA